MKTAVVEKHINNCFIILNSDKRKATFRRNQIIKKIKEYKDLGVKIYIKSFERKGKREKMTKENDNKNLYNTNEKKKEMNTNNEKLNPNENGNTNKEKLTSSVNENIKNVNSDFDENLLEFAMEEKFKLLNYTYEFINKMYTNVQNFPKKHELIKNKLVQTSFELLEKISSGNYSHNKKYKRQMADEAVSKVKTINFLLYMIENDKMISNKMTHRLKLQLDEISKCLIGWRKAI